MLPPVRIKYKAFTITTANPPHHHDHNVLCRQLVGAYAEEQATQDAVYYLGEALRRSVIDLDTYLRHVRALSRRQYQLRATMTLCRQRANLPG